MGTKLSNNINSNNPNNRLEINIVLWAYELSKAADIAQKFLNSPNTIKSNQNCFSLIDDKYEINIYLRSPKALTTSAPKGITSILIIYLSEDCLRPAKIKDLFSNQELSEAKEYFDARKKIPFKILTYESNLSLLQSSEDLLSNYFTEFKKINLTNLTNNSEKSLLLSDAELFESTLLKVFKKFDVDNDDLISYADLINAAKELGQDLASDDAKMIVNSLDIHNPGKIGFESFKKWWVLGRSDFLGFRRACKARLFLDDLLRKAQNGLNSYFANLRNEGKEIIEEELSQVFDVSLHAEKPFEDGIGLFCQFCNGAEALEIIETKFDELEKSEFGFALKFKFESAQAAKNEIGKVEKFISEILCALIGDKVTLVFLLGLVLRFKVTENYVVVFYADKKPKADSMLTDFKALFSGTMHLFTELSFEDLLTIPIEKIIEKLFNAKISVNAKIFDLKQMLKKLLKQIDLVEKSELEIKEKSKNIKSEKAHNINKMLDDNLINEITKDEKENKFNIINIETEKDNNINFNNSNNKKNENNFLVDFKKKYKKILNLVKVYLMLKNIKLELSYDSNCVKEQFFQFLVELNNKIDKEKGDDSFEIKYQSMQEQDDLFESPANLPNLEEKFLGYYNLFDFFLIEIREFYKELVKDKDMFLNLFDQENISFLNKIDLNEVIFECHSRSIITPLYGKLTLKIPKFKNIIENILGNK